MTHNKQKLKEGYYWECSDFFDKLPENIEVPEYQTEIFTEIISHNEILKKYNIIPYTLEQAVGVVLDIIPTLKNDYKGRLVYFEYEGTKYRFVAFRDVDGRLFVFVYRCGPGNEWYAGNGASFSNRTLETKPLTPSSSDTLTLHPTNTEIQNAISICKKAGLKVYEIKEVEL